MNETHSNTLDDVFKTLKNNHTDLFVSIINDAFGTHYTKEDKPALLSTEGYAVNGEDPPQMEKRFSDSLLSLGDETYLIECQSYKDGTMAIRIAEYAFLSARNHAIWDNGRCIIDMPHYVVIYVKCTERTPKETQITFRFPDGKSINYDCKNILLQNYTKEAMIEKKLYAYIPYYIMRYEKGIKKGDPATLDQVDADLKYFLHELDLAFANEELSIYDVTNMKELMKLIIRYISKDKKTEERMINTMGGHVIVTEVDKLVNKGRAEGLSRGRSEGRAEGRTEGITTGRITVYFNDMNLTVPEIAKKLHMTEPEVQNIIDTL